MLAVVDPSVGRDRDIAVETEDGRVLVGPDNGLLAPGWRAAGGPARAVSISSEDVLLQPVSPSFHARDVLAPAAAHLARGHGARGAGRRRSPVESLADLQLPEPLVEPRRIQCEVFDLNRFGNVQLNVRESHLEAAGLDGAAKISVQAHAGTGLAHARRDLRGSRGRRLGPDRRPARLAGRHPRQPCERGGRPRRRHRRSRLAERGEPLSGLVARARRAPGPGLRGAPARRGRRGCSIRSSDLAHAEVGRPHVRRQLLPAQRHRHRRARRGSDREDRCRRRPAPFWW